MFDIGWSELVLIAVVALIAIGPKELPGVLRMVGQWMGKARRMAAEFQGQFQEAMREAEMAELKKSSDEVREAATSFTSNNVMTSLQKDVSEALPYLNAELGGFEYIKDPPSVTFRSQGKLITVHGRKMAVNALKDEAEARKIIEWLKREINRVWHQRDVIVPSYEGMPKPGVFEILRRLPRTNCRKCGAPTCMVFATQVAEGAKGAGNCPELDDSGRQSLNTYMSRFQLDV